jgi:hypothetical protein
MTSASKIYSFLSGRKFDLAAILNHTFTALNKVRYGIFHTSEDVILNIMKPAPGNQLPVFLFINK